MKNTKKIIFLFVTAVLLGCMCVFTASAENEGPYVYEIDSGEVTIVGCDRNELVGDIIIPQTLGGIPVSRIGDRAFYNCEAITSVTIYDNITSIGESAFAFCGAISEVILPDTIEEISDEAFYMCCNLSKVNLANTNIKRIGDRAFAYCEFIQNIVLPETLEKVGTEAFHWCNSMEKLIIGKGVKEIAESAFSNCYALRDIYYTGTQEEFTAIAIAEGNTKLSEAYCYYEHEHYYNEGVEISKGDCLIKGKTEVTCSMCDSSYYELEYGAHTYKNVTKKATFKADGKIDKKCTLCSAIQKTTVIPKAVASFAKTSYAYTGKVLTPAVTVKTTAGKALEKDKTYTVTYSSGRKAFGEYYATVKLSGSQYSGSVKISFNIVPGKATVTVQENADSIKLSWNKVKGATGYRVYAYNTETKKYTTLKTLTGTSYVVTGLDSGTDYAYSVRAYAKVDGKNIWGSHSLVNTATVPAKVKISSASLTDAGKVTLKWNKTTATGYEVYMATGTGQYKKIKTTTKNSTLTFTTSVLEKGKNYSFIIRAYKTVGDSKLYGDYSKVKSVSIK